MAGRRTRSSSGFEGITVGGSGRLVRYLSVVNRIRKRCVLPPRGGAAGCRRIVPTLMTVRRSRSVRNLVVVVGAINNSIRTNLTLTRLVSSVGAPAMSVIINNNRSVNIPLTMDTGGSFVIGSTAVAIRPIHVAKLMLNMPRALSCFRGVRSEVVGFIYSGSGVAPGHFRTLVVGAKRLIVSINAILANRSTIGRKLVSSVNNLRSTVSYLCGVVRDNSWICSVVDRCSVCYRRCAPVARASVSNGRVRCVSCSKGEGVAGLFSAGPTECLSGECRPKREF